MDPAAPQAEAMAVERGRVVALGALREVRERVGRGTELDLGGALLLPGLTDAHGHLRALGERMRGLDLSGVCSSRELLRHVAAAREAIRGEGWLIGFGWDETRFTSVPVSLGALAQELQSGLERAAAGCPLFLERVDGHTALVNRAALNPLLQQPTVETLPEERIARDRTGAATGLLLDEAVELMRGRLPRPDAGELETLLLAAARRCREAGYLAVHDAALEDSSAIALRRLALGGRLPIAVTGYLFEGSPGVAELIAQGCGALDVGEVLRIRGVKLFLDGTLGSRTAALFEPYSDAPGNVGLVRGAERLDATVAALSAQGWQLAIHAIGDRAAALALTALGAPGGRPVPGSPPHRLEHLQLIRPGDRVRMRALGVVASIQPAHFLGDRRWLESRLGPARAALAYDWRALRRLGIPLAAGSDFPIERPDPIAALEAACHPALGPRALEPSELLEALTTGPAYAARGKARDGAIAEGGRAALTLLSPYGGELARALEADAAVAFVERGAEVCSALSL